jgi:lipopolysaccharide/colanic/teichoic acid biosynthesis glycosyltransferase
VSRARSFVVSETAATYEEAVEPASLSAPLPILRRRPSRVNAIACRTLDIVVSAIALIVLSPLLLAVMIWIRRDTRGPAVFRQERLGRDMRPFTVVKFRTMHVNAGNEEHVAFVQQLIAGRAEPQAELFKLTSDARVTRAGRVLRKTSIDELPQLFNVLRGDMSLVGPRPCLDYEAEKFPPPAFGRFAVKPGITGMWQVSGRSKLTFVEQIALDLDYVARRSFWLNVKILLRTVPVVLGARDAA